MNSVGAKREGGDCACTEGVQKSWMSWAQQALGSYGGRAFTAIGSVKDIERLIYMTDGLLCPIGASIKEALATLSFNL